MPLSHGYHCPRSQLLTVLSVPHHITTLLPRASKAHYLVILWVILHLSKLFSPIMAMWPLGFSVAYLTNFTKPSRVHSAAETKGYCAGSISPSQLISPPWTSLSLLKDPMAHTFLWGCLGSEEDNVYKLLAQKAWPAGNFQLAVVAYSCLWALGGLPSYHLCIVGTRAGECGTHTPWATHHPRLAYYRITA